MNKVPEEFYKFYDVVIGSRVTLCRNIKNYRFPNTMDLEDANSIKDILKKHIDYIEGFDFNYTDTEDLDTIEGYKMIEDYIISGELLRNREKSGFFTDINKSATIMVNEENHLKIQVVKEGYNLNEIYELAEKIDDDLGTNIDFAFDYRYGYLTVKATDAGTGLRANILLHLPGLRNSGKMQEIIKRYKKFGLIIKGVYGEGGTVLGDIYQIYNEKTMGMSENDVIEKLEEVVYSLVTQERDIRYELYKNDPKDIEDRVFRAMGTLKYARIIDSNEALICLSNLRLGRALDIYEKISLKEISKLMISIQDNNILYKKYNIRTHKDEEVLRADMIREIFNDLDLEKEEEDG